MRVLVLKSFTVDSFKRKYVYGNCLTVTESLGNKWIEKGLVKKYEGPWPPKKKFKTEFFNPKKDE